MTWDPKNTSPKVIDGNPNMAQVLVAPLIPVKEEMPNLKDPSLEEPLEEHQVDNPSMEVHLAMPWICFEAQVCQDEGALEEPLEEEPQVDDPLMEVRLAMPCQQCSHGSIMCITAGRKGRRMTHSALTTALIKTSEVYADV